MNSKTLAIATLLATLSLPGAVQAENLDHTRQLLATRQCSGCNLSRAGLVFAELSYANLVQADLSGANLSRANLQGADLRGANLMGVSLNGANLAGAKLDGANLMAADLRGAYLAGATLEGTALDNALLQGAIGLSPSMGKVEDFYKWAIEAERQKNYVVAAENFTQVIHRKPTFAPAYFGRGAARAQAGDRKGAIADTREAERLFTAQGDTQSAEVANKIATALEKPPEEEKKRGGFGQMLLGLLGSALQLFLTRFPIPFF
ncbi:MAG: hypothetical protein HC866_17160 [Leptolyngbyaceae cyanobacterium RU_5_1]|nr:hypothetical protein [Leptolyngbyaceae cyanobacterium RU_5_1]